MRVLTVLTKLEIGGTQLNAIQFAAAMRQHGIDSTVVGLRQEEDEDVSIVEVAAALDVEVRVVDEQTILGAASALSALAARRRFDLIHSYGSGLSRPAFWGPNRLGRIPLLMTIYEMAARPSIYRWPHLIVGTRYQYELLRESRGRVHFVSPPVDLANDDPDVVSGEDFMRTLQLAPNSTRLLMVNRLDEVMKASGVELAMQAVKRLGTQPIELVVVGTGNAEPRLRLIGDAINDELGRRAVVFVGPLADPRPAYAAADVVLAMGGSAARGLAFGRPLIVVGENGWSAAFTPESSAQIFRNSFWGDTPVPQPVERLSTAILSLARDRDWRLRLGAYGREFAIKHFGLDAMARKQAEIYRLAVAEGNAPTRWIHDAICQDPPAACRALARRIRRAWRAEPPAATVTDAILPRFSVLQEARKMNLLMIIPSLLDGGADRAFRDQASEFSKFANVTTVVLKPSECQPCFQSDAKPAQWLGSTSPPRGFRRIIRIGQQAVLLHRKVNRDKIDVVISHLDAANIVNCLSLSRAKKLLVLHMTVDSEPSPSIFHTFFRRTIGYPILYNLSNRVVAVSKDLANELSSYGIVRACTINNFFDIRRIEDSSLDPIQEGQSCLFDHRRKALVAVGRLSEQKQHLELLDVFRRVVDRRLPARLIIMGSGPQRENLLGRSRELGLRAAEFGTDDIDDGVDVVLVPWQRNPFALVRRCDLFLFPSAWEGFPLALCEAMIVGVPVMSADCPTGPREILCPDEHDVSVEEGHFGTYGALMPMIREDRDAEVWANAVERLLGEPETARRMAEMAKVRVRDFETTRVVAKWRSLFQEIGLDTEGNGHAPTPREG